MMESTPKPQELLEELKSLKDWESRCRYIVALGQKLEPMTNEEKTDDTKLKGCQSSVWLDKRFCDGHILLKADSDSAIIKGLVAIIVIFYSNKTPEEVLQFSTTTFEKVGVSINFSQTRTNSLVGVIKSIQAYALEKTSEKTVHEK